jgi:hypothetical protein
MLITDAQIPCRLGQGSGFVNGLKQIAADPTCEFRANSIVNRMVGLASSVPRKARPLNLRSIAGIGMRRRGSPANHSRLY